MSKDIATAQCSNHSDQPPLQSTLHPALCPVLLSLEFAPSYSNGLMPVVSDKAPADFRKKLLSVFGGYFHASIRHQDERVGWIKYCSTIDKQEVQRVIHQWNK